jgi:hypothetical protein
MTQKEKDKLIQEIEEVKDKGKYSDMYDCGYRDGNLNVILAIIEIIKNFKSE